MCSYELLYLQINPCIMHTVVQASDSALLVLCFYINNFALSRMLISFVPRIVFFSIALQMATPFLFETVILLIVLYSVQLFDFN